ncbi:MAG: hypothetical protein AAFY03_10090 [Pseudomonadota bacterium]
MGMEALSNGFGFRGTLGIGARVIRCVYRGWSDARQWALFDNPPMLKAAFGWALARIFDMALLRAGIIAFLGFGSLLDLMD